MKFGRDLDSIVCTLHLALSCDHNEYHEDSLFIILPIFSRCCVMEPWVDRLLVGEDWSTFGGEGVMMPLGPKSTFLRRAERASSMMFNIPLCSCSSPYSFILLASCCAFFFRRHALLDVQVPRMFSVANCCFPRAVQF